MLKQALATMVEKNTSVRSVALYALEDSNVKTLHRGSGMIFTHAVRCKAGVKKNCTYTKKEEPSVLEGKMEMSQNFYYFLSAKQRRRNVTKLELKQLGLQFTTYRTKEISLKCYFFLVTFEMLHREKKQHQTDALTKATALFISAEGKNKQT